MTQRLNPDAGEYLTPSQAAALVGVTPRTIYRYGTDGRISYLALPSGHRRYHRESVEALVADTVAA